jgi:hypothetical protein
LDLVRSVDVRWLQRQGYLRPYPACTVRWPCWEADPPVLALDWTSQPFGGYRPWLLCPACGKRFALLYRYAGIWRCRRCIRIPYGSQCEGTLERRYRALRKLRRRLGASMNLFDSVDPWRKPKGMHGRTFQRLYMREMAAHMAVLEAIAGHPL